MFGSVGSTAMARSSSPWATRSPGNATGSTTSTSGRDSSLVPNGNRVSGGMLTSATGIWTGVQLAPKSLLMNSPAELPSGLATRA